MCRFHLQGEIRSCSRSGPEHKLLWETCKNANHMSIETNHTRVARLWYYLDCWPSGRFWVGFIVPADEQATIIFASLSSLASTPATLSHKNKHSAAGYKQYGNGLKLLICSQCHTLNKLRILFCAREDTEECKAKTASYVPWRPFPYQSVHLHIDSSRWMTLQNQTHMNSPLSKIQRDHHIRKRRTAHLLVLSLWSNIKNHKVVLFL